MIMDIERIVSVIPTIPERIRIVLVRKPSTRITRLATIIDTTSTGISSPLVLPCRLSIGLKSVRKNKLIENRLNTKRTSSLVIKNK